jgi:hypothetical protein
LGEGAATVRRHDPEDFIVRFSRHEDMEMVGAATVRRHDPEDFIVRFSVLTQSRREDMEMVGAATVRRHDPEDFVVRFSRRRDGTGHSGGRCPVHADIDMATVAEDIPGHCGFIQVQAARRDEAGSSAC